MFRLDHLRWTRLGMPIVIFAVAVAAFAAISTTRADEPPVGANKGAGLTLGADAAHVSLK
jgi:hypothetical protein